MLRQYLSNSLAITLQFSCGGAEILCVLCYFCFSICPTNTCSSLGVRVRRSVVERGGSTVSLCLSLHAARLKVLYYSAVGM